MSLDFFGKGYDNRSARYNIVFTLGKVTFERENNVFHSHLRPCICKKRITL